MTTIFHLSDWHQRNDGFDQQLDFEIRSQQLGEPDLIIVTGDMLWNFAPARSRQVGRDAYEERRQLVHYQHFIDRLEAVWPGVDIFAVRGNHDWCDYEIKGHVRAFDALEGGTYLWNGLKIYGFRGIPEHYGNWNDEYNKRALDALCDLVPGDTDILITHCPPEGILDDVHDSYCFICGNRLNKNGTCIQTHIYDPAHPAPVIVPKNIGSSSVRALVEKLPKLKAHFFGHVHECGGRVETRNFGHTVIFSNASCTLNKVVL